MADPRGFLEVSRVAAPERDPRTRTRDHREIFETPAASRTSSIKTTPGHVVVTHEARAPFLAKSSSARFESRTVLHSINVKYGS